MGRENVLLAGRAFLLTSGALVDTCTVQHPTGLSTNPANGVVTPTFSTVYTGPCQFQAATAIQAGNSELAEAAVRLANFELQLPVVGSEGIEVDDVVTCVTCLNDTDLAGRTFVVTGASRKSHATTRKLPLLDVLS